MAEKNQVTAIYAIGCVSFVSKDLKEADFNDYSTSIRTSLEKIDNVSDVKVDDVSAFQYRIAHPSPQADYVNGPFVPCPARGSVSFNVFIPEHVQEEVLPYRRASLGCERFIVVVSFNYDFPIAVFSPAQELKGDISGGFSEYVAIVREYLMSRWGKTDPIQIAFLGPSPFHAEFLLTKDLPAAQLNVKKQLGYDDICYPAEPKDAMANFLDETCSVLSSYYLAVYTRNASVEMRDMIVSEVRLTLSRLTERNVFKKLFNFFAHSNRQALATIYSDLFELEELAESFKVEIAERRSKDEKYSRSPLWTYVEAEIGHIPRGTRGETQHFTRLAEIFEMGSSTNFAVVISAIVSAALTAIATVALTLLKDGG